MRSDPVEKKVTDFCFGTNFCAGTYYCTRVFILLLRIKYNYWHSLIYTELYICVLPVLDAVFLSALVLFK